MKSPGREPIQVYLTAAERSWLDALASRDGVSRSEVLRRGIRRLMTESATESTSPTLRFLDLAAADPALARGPSDISSRPVDYLIDAQLDRIVDEDATGAP